MFYALLALLKRAGRSPIVTKAAHTFWQAFLATFTVGVPVLLTASHTSAGAAEAALVSLATASAAAGFSAIKTMFVGWKG